MVGCGHDRNRVVFPAILEWVEAAVVCHLEVTTAPCLVPPMSVLLIVGDSATYLYINEVLIRSAKVAVIVRGSLTLLVIGLFFVFLVIRVYDLN